MYIVFHSVSCLLLSIKGFIPDRNISELAYCQNRAFLDKNKALGTEVAKGMQFQNMVGATQIFALLGHQVTRKWVKVHKLKNVHKHVMLGIKLKGLMSTLLKGRLQMEKMTQKTLGAKIRP